MNYLSRRAPLWAATAHGLRASKQKGGRAASHSFRSLVRRPGNAHRSIQALAFYRFRLLRQHGRLLAGQTGGPPQEASSQPQSRPVQPVTKIAPPTPIQIQRVETGGPTWNHDWDRTVERALPRE